MAIEKKRKTRKITSGDKLADWFFNRLMDAADKKVGDVNLRKLIRGKIEKVGKHYVVKGELARTLLFFPENGKIAKHDIDIEYRLSKRTKGRVFMHELIHIEFTDIRERYVLQLERRLWSKLCEDQKQAIIKKMYELVEKSR